MKPAVVISTFPSKRSLTKIANQLVRDKIVACVNFFPISSVYSWRGKIENEGEYLGIFKTAQKNKDLLKKTLAELHPYDVPEIAEIDVSSVNPSYMRWVLGSTI